jgi:hypothetical protein
MANLLQKFGALLASVIQQLGSWFGIVIDKGEQLYEELSDEEKQAAQWGSGVLAVVNQDLNAIPADVIKVIEQKFPELDLDTLHGFIDELRNKVDTVQSQIPLTLEDAIAWLQGHLKKYEGDNTTLGIITKGLANILALIFVPGTAAQKIGGALEYIYHLIIKPHVQGTTAAQTAQSPEPAPTPAPEEHNPAQGSIEPPATPEADGNDNGGVEVTTLAEAEQQQSGPVDNQPAGTTVPAEDATPEVDAPAPVDPDMQISNEAAASLDDTEKTQVADIQTEQNLSYDEAIEQLKREEAAQNGEGEQA